MGGGNRPKKVKIFKNSPKFQFLSEIQKLYTKLLQGLRAFKKKIFKKFVRGFKGVRNGPKLKN